MAPLLSRIINAIFYLRAAKESRFNAVLALYNKNFGKTRPVVGRYRKMYF